MHIKLEKLLEMNKPGPFRGVEHWVWIESIFKWNVEEELIE